MDSTARDDSNLEARVTFLPRDLPASSAKSPVTQSAQRASRGFLEPPPEIFQTRGAVRDVYDLIIGSCRYPQPVFALAGALIAVSTTCGSKYYLQDGGRLNLYTVSIGVSGCGKEQVGAAIKRVLELAGLEDRIAAEGIASGAGVEDCLTRSNVCLFVLDEFGELQARLTAPGDSDNGILKTLLEIFSKSGGHFRCRARAGVKPPIIKNPTVSIYGSSTPEQLLRSIHTSTAESGFMSRFLYFPSELRRPRRQQPKYIAELPPGLKASLDELARGEGPIPIRFEPGAQELSDQYLDELDGILRDPLGPVQRAAYVRRGEAAARIMGVLAAGRNPSKPKISVNDFHLAKGIVTWSFDACFREIDGAVRRNSGDAGYARIVDIVRRAEELIHMKDANHPELLKAGVVPRRMIQARMSVGAAKFNDLLQSVVDSGEIVAVEDPQRPGQILGYRARD